MLAANCPLRQPQRPMINKLGMSPAY